MGLIKIHTSYNLAEMAVLQSELDAAGIYNFVQSGSHGNIFGMGIIALGGLRLYIHENDVEEAKTFFRARDEIKDFDPIYEHKWGRWKTALLFGFATGIFVPFYYLKTRTQLIILTATLLISIALFRLLQIYPSIPFKPFVIYFVVVGFIFNILTLILLPIIWHARAKTGHSKKVTL